MTAVSVRREGRFTHYPVVITLGVTVKTVKTV